MNAGLGNDFNKEIENENYDNLCSNNCGCDRYDFWNCVRCTTVFQCNYTVDSAYAEARRDMRRDGNRGRRGFIVLEGLSVQRRVNRLAINDRRK